MMLLSVLSPAKELDLKLSIKQLPIKRDGKQPYSELQPLGTPSAKSL